MRTSLDTHEVINQPGDLVGANAYADDRALTEAVEAFGGGWAADQLASTGAVVGSAEVQVLARQANKATPELVTHDRFGHRVDEVDLHPAWHRLMELAFQSGAHSLAWRERRAGAHVARAALSYLWNQAENGVCCPMGMTFASVAALRHSPELAAAWEPRILADAYDPRPRPAEDKRGITVGMAMTEKQGGSDLRRTQTTARPASSAQGSGAPYLLTGHKWFFSVPQSDLFLTLAQTERGVSCFLARGWLPDGRRNRLRLQRLKDKCGNRSNASSEVEFADLEAVLVGEEGRGIRAIIEMAHLTRLDFAVGSAGLMRQALSQAIHHTRNRTAFQRRLVDLPIMRSVVADLAVESEAATWLTLRLASTLDAGDDAHERLLGRIATPVAKYWVCKRAVGFVAEALECHGGNGFIENHLMARLYREAPLNGIWEGTGNVICLDVARAVAREPETVDAFLAEVRRASGEPALDRAVQELEPVLRDIARHEAAARWVVERMALVLCASLLLRHAPREVADAYVAHRLANAGGLHYGASGQTAAAQAIIDGAALG
ncbi:acyl-CoA dehydrogenase family protein [Acuticoccus sp.]|uniref:acyl-CoA dehydrogenase family protein n=1 Tax=Acuticoccus sp. TaxID=1904378 RepID=UPI003B51CC51